MADEPKLDLEQIKAFTGITDANTNEEFNEKFKAKFYTKDQIFKDEEVKAEFFGRAFGSATTGIKQLFDADGIEITGEDLKQPIEKVVKLGVQRYKEQFAAREKELQTTAGLTADEKIKEFQENANKLQQKIKDLEGVAKSRAVEIEEIKNNTKAEFKKFRVNSIYKDIEGSIQWNPDKDEYSKVGFLTKMKDKYYIELDENDNPEIFDKSNNSRIKAEGSHSTFMKPSEVYKMESIKAGLAAVNKKAGQPPNHQKTTPPPANNGGNQNNPNQPHIRRGRVMANTSYRPNVAD